MSPLIQKNQLKIQSTQQIQILLMNIMSPLIQKNQLKIQSTQQIQILLMNIMSLLIQKNQLKILKTQQIQILLMNKFIHRLFSNGVLYVSRFKDVNKKFNTYIAAFSNNKFIEVSHDKITKVLIGYCFRTYSSIHRVIIHSTKYKKQRESRK